MRDLGSAPRERFFGADHLSQVHGLRLDDVTERFEADWAESLRRAGA